MADWQDISTAPRDKDIQLYCSETGEQFVAFWGVSIEEGDGQWVFAQAKDCAFIVKNPTHWQPLPQPPKDGSE